MTHICDQCKARKSIAYVVYLPRFWYYALCKPCYQEVKSFMSSGVAYIEFVRVSKHQYELELLKQAL